MTKQSLRTNMVQGNALTRLNDHGETLIFSERKILPVKRGMRKVQWNLYTFDAIIDQGDAESTVQVEQSKYEEMEMFADLFVDDELETPLVKYVPVKLTEIYKELVEVIDSEFLWKEVIIWMMNGWRMPKNIVKSS